jgi:excisionase family DNA binding protein
MDEARICYGTRWQAGCGTPCGTRLRSIPDLFCKSAPKQVPVVFTVEQIASTLQVQEQTVSRWLRVRALSGKFFGGKTGWRVRQTDLNAFPAADKRSTQNRVDA